MIALEHAIEVLIIGMENKLLGSSTSGLKLIIKILEHNNWPQQSKNEESIRYMYELLVVWLNQLDFKLQPLKFKVFELLRKENTRLYPDKTIDGIENYNF